MRHEELAALARSKRWSDLEQQWLAAIEDTAGDVEIADFLPAIELTVQGGQAALAETMAWAWLTEVKQRSAPLETLELARALLLRLPSGDQLREEVLALYRQTHAETPGLERWIELSGLTSGKSVRRALRFLDIGLQLKPEAFLLHRSEDVAGELTEADLAANVFTVRTSKRTLTLTVEQLIETFDIADPTDFRVLRELRPDAIADLIENDPQALLIGIARSHNGRIDRDELKRLLVPRYLTAEQWNSWWNRARNAIKRSRHLRIEGRSPMMILYDAGGMSLEEETWESFEKARTPREWLETVEAYLRGVREQKATADPAFLERIQRALVAHATKAAKHDPSTAFATALVIERLAGEGLPVHPEAHGLALSMLQSSSAPARLVAELPDAGLWAVALPAVRQALPDRWPEVFAELLVDAPGTQVDALASALVETGRSELIQPVVDRALADPWSAVDVLMWAWRGAGAKVRLTLPPRTEHFAKVLALVGPARERAGAEGRDVTALRAKVRAGLSYRDYSAFREMLEAFDDSMAAATRRQIERAEGLGPVVQGEMLDIVRERFPMLYVKARLRPWEEEGVIYVTARGLRDKEAELDELVNVKMRENAKAIGAAAEHGDLSENSEYKFALEERDLLRARLAQINFEMSLARVLEPEDVPDDHVSIGHAVHLTPEDRSEPIVVTLLGPWESDLSRNIYSYQTPFAKKLLGRARGEIVTLTIGERERTYRIDGIECAIAHQVPAPAAS
ncbi:MAG: GreA/GreB family elongation factor [Phycisphaerae bacterium]|nr:GreA/GreB family elongation factor [Phycisphaerae bacterium]